MPSEAGLGAGVWDGIGKGLIQAHRLTGVGRNTKQESPPRRVRHRVGLRG